MRGFCYTAFMINKDAITLIENRRSCRSFSAERVTPETLETLKRLTLRAPSGGNMLLYTIMEITDDEKKAKLAKICDNQVMVAKAPLVWIFLADVNRWEAYFRASRSPEKVGIPLRKAGIGDFHLAMQDAIIAAQTAATAAESLGLGSCYIGDIIENYEQLQELLALPSHAAPAAMLIMGYPSKGAYTSLKTLRPPTDSQVFQQNSYHTATKEELEQIYGGMEDRLRGQGRLPEDNTGTLADYYYNRKYSSSFMAEMNRSTAVFLERWCKEEK